MKRHHTTIEQKRNEILAKVKEYYSVKEGEYRSHASDPVAIVEMLYEYVFSLRRNTFSRRLKKLFKTDYLPSIDDYSVEFLETTQSVLKSYSPDRGDFFAYYETSLIKALWHTMGKDVFVDAHGGMKVPYGKTIKTISNIFRKYTECVEPEEVTDIAKKEYGVTLNETDVTDYIAVMLRLDGVMGDDEEDSSEIIEVVSDPNCIGPEEVVIQEEQNKLVIGCIEDAFLCTQERQRKYLGAVLTARCSEWIYCNQTSLFPLISGMEWFDQDVYSVYLATGKAKEQREIANEYSMKGSSISRAFKEFLERYMDRSNLEELLGIIKAD